MWNNYGILRTGSNAYFSFHFKFSFEHFVSKFIYLFYSLLFIYLKCNSFERTLRQNYSRLDNLTSAVGETSVSRHNGGPIKGPLQPFNTIALWCTGGFREALNWTTMMPRNASLSVSYTSDRCLFFPRNYTFQKMSHYPSNNINPGSSLFSLIKNVIILKLFSDSFMVTHYFIL